MPCKQTHEMHIQMQHKSLWACSPYLCAQNFNWSPYFVISLPLCQSSPLCYLFTIFVRYFSPFVINDHKGLILDRLRLSMSINGVRIIFPNLVQSRTLAKDIQLGLIQGQASSHLQIWVILYHVELNTYNLFSRSN